MRGWWKPILPYTAFALAVLGVRWLLGDRDVALFAVAPLVVVPVVLAGAWWAQRPLRRFLEGLAEGGEHLTVERDEATWFGGREVEARGVRGPWRLRLVYGFSPTLFAMGPDDREPRVVEAPEREAGREAARRALRA